MQTAEYKTEQSAEKSKLTPFSLSSRPVVSPSFRSWVPSLDNAPFWLNFAIFTPFALFFTFFCAALLSAVSPTLPAIAGAAATLVLSAGLFVFSFFIVSCAIRERERRERELARARCLLAIADIMNGSFVDAREKLRRMTRLLADEGDRSAWRSRVVLQENRDLLPPAGGAFKFQVPLVADGKNVGVVLVTAHPSRLDAVEKDFFESLSRLLGPFVLKERAWLDFHAEVERLQAALLLQSVTGPESGPGLQAHDVQTVEHMLATLGLFQGKVENSVDNKL